MIKSLNRKHLLAGIVILAIIATGYLLLGRVSTRKRPKYVLPVDRTVELNKRLQNIAEQDAQKYGLDGLSISVSLPAGQYTLNYTTGYADTKTKRLIFPSTPFQVGSITKTYTAVLTYIMENKHKLKLNESITTWLPRYTKWKNITIANLLNHTSGLFNTIDEKDYWKNVVANPTVIPTKRELADKAYKHPLRFQPGTHYYYTNTDYLVLALILEKVSGQSFSNLMRSYLTGRALNTPKTIYRPSTKSDTLMATIAHGYNREGTFTEGTDVTTVTAGITPGASGLVTTPAELNKFIRLLFTGRIIPLNTLLQMQKLVAIPNGQAVNADKIRARAKNVVDSIAEVGAGDGMGLVYFPGAGFQWMHSSSLLGYEALYAYNPCSNIVVTLAYNTRPKTKRVFLNVFKDINQTLKVSHIVGDQVEAFKRVNRLPAFCTSSTTTVSTPYVSLRNTA